MTEEISKKVTHTKIGNLEPIKRAFCNKEFDEFTKLISEQPYKLYEATYIYSNEYVGKPDFILDNKNKGFIQTDVMESKRNYMFVAFVCTKEEEKLMFKSYWIVNSTDPLESILEDDYQNFEFVETNVDTVVNGFKTNKDSVISLVYLH